MKSKRNNYFLRRTLALLIALTMSIGLLQITALAEGEEVPQPPAGETAPMETGAAQPQETPSDIPVVIEVNGVPAATATMTAGSQELTNVEPVVPDSAQTEAAGEETPAPQEPQKEAATETVDKIVDGEPVQATQTTVTETDAEGNTTTSVTTEWNTNKTETTTTEEGATKTETTTTTEKEWETEKKDADGEVIETGTGASGSSETTTTTKGQETADPDKSTEGKFEMVPGSEKEDPAVTAPATDVTTEVKEPVSVEVNAGETKTEDFQPVITNPPEERTFTETDENGVEIKTVVKHLKDEAGRVIGVTTTTTKVVGSTETTVVEETKEPEVSTGTTPPVRPEPSENQDKTVEGTVVEVEDVMDAEGNIIGYKTITTVTDAEGNQRVESKTEYATNKTQQTVTTTTTTTTKHMVEGSTETIVNQPGHVTAGLKEVTSAAEGSNIPKVTGATVTLTGGNITDGYNVDVVLKLSGIQNASGDVTLKVTYDGKEYVVDLNKVNKDGEYTLEGLPKMLGGQELKLTLTGTQVKQIVDSTTEQENKRLQAENGVWKDTFNYGGGTSLGDAGNFSVFAKDYTVNSDMEGNIAVGTLHFNGGNIGVDKGVLDKNFGLEGFDFDSQDYSNKYVKLCWNV